MKVTQFLSSKIYLDGEDLEMTQFDDIESPDSVSMGKRIVRAQT